MKPLWIEGLLAAVVTPMNRDGSLNLEMIPRIVDHLEARGITGAYILGSNGEGVLQTDGERRTVAETYVKAVSGKMKSIVQVGHGSWKMAAELASHAQEIGADAVSATPFTFFELSGEQALVDGMAEVAAGAGNLPFYYYHIPQLSGAKIDVKNFTKLATAQIPNYAGIKYSDGSTLYNLQSLQSLNPNLEYLGGSDESYLMSLVQGYKGVVGSTYNYGAPIYDQVREAVLNGDFETARIWQHRAQQMIDTLFATCGRAGLKAMMKMVGIDCGPPRGPIVASTPEQEAELKRRLEEMGWFEWVGLESSIAV